MTQAIQKVRRNFRDYGLSQTLLKVIVSMIRPLFYSRTYRLYRADLAQVRIPPITDPSFVFRFLEINEKDYLAQIQRMEEWLQERLETILQEGGQCLVALDEDRVAGFNLVSFRHIHLPIVHFKRALRSGQAYSEQITVSKAYRGRGLGATLRLELFRILRAQGKRYLYGGTDVHNQANLALCRKVGLQEVADIRYVKILRIERTAVRRISR
jgi:ribosomal protein S18 acetylase RimI-like enzyme